MTRKLWQKKCDRQSFMEKLLQTKWFGQNVMEKFDGKGGADKVWHTMGHTKLCGQSVTDKMWQTMCYRQSESFDRNV